MRLFKPGDRVRYVGRKTRMSAEAEARARHVVPIGALGTVRPIEARFRMHDVSFVVVEFDGVPAPGNVAGLWQCPPESLRHVYDGDEPSTWDAEDTVWVPAALRA